ncbi:hypothetical protein DRH27_00995, partial [Candidatus Falkowbacteria bacterium]
MFNKKFAKFIILSIIFIFGLSGCALFPASQKSTKTLPLDNAGKNNPLENGQVDQGDQVSKSLEAQLAAQSNINKFEDYDELKEFLENSDLSSNITYSSLSRGLGVVGMETMTGETMKASPGIGLDYASDLGLADASESAPGLGAGSDDFSLTNVQVKGVDEADIIKTDGEYIYAVVKNNLFIIKAYPAENSEILAKIEFKSRPQDIYINGSSLVVFGSDTQIYKTDTYQRFPRRSSYTFFKVFDITDRKNPKQVRDLDIEGNYFNSRMIGDYVYFATNNYNWYWYDDILPIPLLLEGGEAVTSDCASARCYHPDVYYFNIPYDSYNFTSINAINIKDNNKQVNGEVYLLSGNQNMYVSKENIYITYTKYISEYQLEMEVMKEIIYPNLSARNQEKIAKIQQAENYILSQNEKTNKISTIIERYASSLSSEEQEKLEKLLEEKIKQKYKDISKELEKTVIHKIAIKGDKLEYKTHGEVTGQVLNQFSMDESSGYFRIATTKNRTWSRYDEASRQSYNNLYVLDENLKQVGAVENLAPDERIYSVRFMQNRAYMVTFKQMDPLFVIDLSDPKNPQVLGKLKVPGFSNYLHPFDDNTLIGIGKDTSESEWGGATTKGLKLSLFDVSDVNNPEEIDTYIMGDAGSDSIALNDHKAFLFSRDKNLLAIPVSIRESFGSMNYGKLTFSGTAVFNIDKTGFEFKGKIDHSDGGRASA